MQELWTERDGLNQIKLGEKWYEWDKLYPRAVSFYETKYADQALPTYQKSVFGSFGKLLEAIENNENAVVTFFCRVVEIATEVLAVSKIPKAKGAGKAHPKAAGKAHPKAAEPKAVVKAAPKAVVKAVAKPAPTAASAAPKAVAKLASTAVVKAKAEKADPTAPVVKAIAEKAAPTVPVVKSIAEKAAPVVKAKAETAAPTAPALDAMDIS